MQFGFWALEPRVKGFRVRDGLGFKAREGLGFGVGGLRVCGLMGFVGVKSFGWFQEFRM